jgi:hypothetical protein
VLRLDQQAIVVPQPLAGGHRAGRCVACRLDQHTGGQRGGVSVVPERKSGIE